MKAYDEIYNEGIRLYKRLFRISQLFLIFFGDNEMSLEKRRDVTCILLQNKKNKEKKKLLMTKRSPLRNLSKH